MLEEHHTKVSGSAKERSGASLRKKISDVLLDLETDLMDTSVKTLIFRTAVPVLRGRFSEKITNSAGQTAFHGALRKDRPTRHQPEKYGRTNTGPSLAGCWVTASPVELSRAVTLLSIKTTNDEGEACLHLALKYDLHIAEELIALSNSSGEQLQMIMGLRLSGRIETPTQSRECSIVVAQMLDPGSPLPYDSTPPAHVGVRAAKARRRPIRSVLCQSKPRRQVRFCGQTARGLTITRHLKAPGQRKAP